MERPYLPWQHLLQLPSEQQSLQPSGQQDPQQAALAAIWACATGASARTVTTRVDARIAIVRFMDISLTWLVRFMPCLRAYAKP